ncbi:chromosome partitioning protein ParB [Kaistia algarum]|uniref:ParB/RepB/Spo0J family partition protein n=1 Tax=Kaistia algarum TaxID=2083279 RepID=UPI000CE71F31|nr:ParB N-terminal domain-containing protein [Kaistia algarum]MCX5512243.1 ParB N-terminal domain-containing protein [Kaistia algarum]PPE80337.1 chromosome partitioning protein ParB [Kaistia algarum]
MTTIHVPLNLIDIPADRLRALDAEWVEALAMMMRQEGQLQPITLRPSGDRYSLVFGEHRFAAVARNGWADIEASVREMTDDEARLAEIDENLIRRELGPLDRALFLAERKRVWERLHPQTRDGGDRKSSEFKAKNQIAKLAMRFSEEVAEKVGLSERSVQRACDIASGLRPDAVTDIRRTYLANHQRDLEAFSKLSPDSQRIALEKLTSGEAETIKAAFAEPGERIGPPPVTSEKMLGLWSRMAAKEKRRFLETIGVDADAHDRIVNPRRREVR